MLKSISPIDGRYALKTKELGEYFSEFALIKYRVFVEIEFLKYLLEQKEIKADLNPDDIVLLDAIAKDFSEKDALEIKEIEKITNHDVKAVEYFLKEKITNINKDVIEFVHFACTSEDINNLSYALMIKDGINGVVIPELEGLLVEIEKSADIWASTPMLSRTHGQPASPTTVGKEFKIFASRLKRQLLQIKNQKYLGKLNGASGNYNAHCVACPDIDWIGFSKNFIKKIGLEANLLTNQIEPHDFLSEIFDAWSRVSTILIDFNKDMWTYISFGFFKQKLKKGEIGSSAMPHKVNPIDFENSEGNAGMAIAVFGHLARKLPISRMQRDLTDSTVLRNIGVGFAYLLIAIKSSIRGIAKLELNESTMLADLDNNQEVLAEAVQTVMRKSGIENPYEKLKDLTRGKKLTGEDVKNFIEKLDLDKSDKELLLSLSPSLYIGFSKKLALLKD